MNSSHSKTSVSPETSVGILVAERPARTRIFERLGIDYCCSGDRTLADACRDQDLDPDTVATMLDAAADSGPAAESATDWRTAPLADLMEHITSTHHAFLRRELPRLDTHLSKVARVHGEEAGWIVDVKDEFDALKEDLESHMQKEETIVFPFIQALANGETTPDTSTLDGDPLALMEAEHDGAGTALKRIRDLSDGYSVPDWACSTFRAAVDGLRELEQDLHQHIHKENNALFPRARSLR
jgi:regulator of cell morphogenesis and NO signaling